MAEKSEHPITTPKGASAVAIVLGVVSVLAPFLFNLESALLFSGLAVLVICWVYWAEARSALATRQWSTHLNVPLGSILAIVLMAAVTVRHGEPASPPVVPALSADDLAHRVAVILRSDSPSPPPGRPIVMASPPPIIRIVPAIAPPPSASPAPAAQSANTNSATFEAALARSRAYDAASDALHRCMQQLIPLESRAFGLDIAAVNALNSWGISRDDRSLADEYKIWIGKVEEFFSESKDRFPDVSAFEDAKDPDPRPTFLFIHNEGYHDWVSMSAKRKAFDDIVNSYEKTACKAEDNAVTVAETNGM